MTSEGGNAAAPLTRADTPELVKKVAEALAKPPPGDPSTSSGKLFIVRGPQNVKRACTAHTKSKTCKLNIISVHVSLEGHELVVGATVR